MARDALPPIIAEKCGGAKTLWTPRQNFVPSRTGTRQAEKDLKTFDLFIKTRKIRGTFAGRCIKRTNQECDFEHFI